MNNPTWNVHVQKTLSDDKQFQEQLALEIKNRFAYKAQDAWLKYLQNHSYPDYTIGQLGKAGFQWRLDWMVEEMSKSIAQITATLTDLLGVANDLRALSKAKSSDEMEDIAGELRRRSIFGKQAE